MSLCLRADVLLTQWGNRGPVALACSLGSPPGSSEGPWIDILGALFTILGAPPVHVQTFFPQGQLLLPWIIRGFLGLAALACWIRALDVGAELASGRPWLSLPAHIT